jgi:hypothetical protein
MFDNVADSFDRIKEYVPIACAWTIVVVKEFKDLVSWKSSAWVVLLLSTAATALALLGVYQLKHGEPLVAFAGMEQITAASGAATVDDWAFVVGDERRQGLYRLKWNGRQYDNAVKCTIRRSDDRLVEPNDLEAVVRKPDGTLWLLTSHSNRPDGSVGEDRQLLLEVDIPDAAGDGCTARVEREQHELRAALVQGLSSRLEFDRFKNGHGDCDDKPEAGCGYQNEDKKFEILQIEGIALDATGEYAYLGLRAPLVDVGGQRHAALVLRTRAGSLFETAVTFEVFPVILESDKHSYGISSLDVDPETGRFVMLGNSPSNRRTLTPVVCTWSAEEGASAACRQFPRFAEPAPWARPEALVFAPDGHVVVFLDGENRAYGEVVLTRGDLGL